MTPVPDSSCITLMMKPSELVPGMWWVKHKPIRYGAVSCIPYLFDVKEDAEAKFDEFYNEILSAHGEPETATLDGGKLFMRWIPKGRES